MTSVRVRSAANSTGDDEPARRCSMWREALRCVSPSHSKRALTKSNRAYMEAGSRTSCGDHRRSAIAAFLGHMRESTFSGLTYSAHMHDSPPRIRCFSSADRFAASPLIGSTAEEKQRILGGESCMWAE